MVAPKGNQFWKARSKHGRDKIFKTPKALRSAAEEYFQWVEDNPLEAAELVKYQGRAKVAKVPKMRAMTITGLVRFLHIDNETWYKYKKLQDFIEVIREIEGIIYDQKFSGAAAEMLNANIIARELGLKDKTDLSSEDGSMTPVTRIERVIVKNGG